VQSRRSGIKRNISTGGTAAPRSAARGPTTGLAPNGRAGKTGLAQNEPAPAGRRGGLDAAPQPGAPSAVAQPTLMPWDMAAQNQIAGAGKSLNDTLAGLDSQWAQRQQAYGLEGPWADYTTNPHSQAALLQRSYDIANRAAKTGAGYNLYSGSQVNARNFNTRGFNEGRDQLQRAAAEDFLQYQSGRTRAEDEYRESIADAEMDRINAGLAAPLDSAGAPGGGKAWSGQAPKGKGAGTIKPHVKRKRGK
jgi:hypothetical protein